MASADCKEGSILHEENPKKKLKLAFVHIYLLPHSVNIWTPFKILSDIFLEQNVAMHPVYASEAI
jgi:hypothetical protein